VKQFTVEARVTAGLSAREQRELACRRVYDAMVSNEGVQRKSMLVVHLLTTLLQLSARLPQREAPLESSLVDLHQVGEHVRKVDPVLRSLEELRGQPYTKVALEARQLMMRVMTPSIQKRQQVLHSKLLAVTNDWAKASDTPVIKGYKQFSHLLQPLVQSVTSVFEELSVFLQPQNPTAIRLASLELFIRRSHRQYTVSSLSIRETSSPEKLLVAELWFQRQSVLGSNSINHSSSDNLSASSSADNLGERSPLPAGVNSPMKAVQQHPTRKAYRRSDSSFGAVQGSFSDSILDMQVFPQP
ncbi:acetyl-CoA carboxylase, partial [Baffinella frigidus]